MEVIICSARLLYLGIARDLAFLGEIFKATRIIAIFLDVHLR